VDPVQGLGNTTIDFQGCSTCVAEAMAETMKQKPHFKELMFKALLIFGLEAAKNKP